MGGRSSRLPVLPPVVQFTVAPHRYLYTKTVETGDIVRLSYQQAFEAAPYKAGEVIYVVHGDGFRRAYIHGLLAKKNSWDMWREAYWVRPETKAGLWAKRHYIAHPGYIQRGYQRAGLAPERSA